jgi:acetyl-CoA acetyltransferase
MGHTLPDDTPYTARSLTAEAARLAIDDAGLERTDIDGALHLMSAPGPRIRVLETDGYPRVLGLPVNFYFHVGRGGAPATLAIATAMSFLEHGLANYVVIAGGANDKKHKRPGVPKTGVSSYAFGASKAVALHSLIASRHMAEFGTTSRQLGMVTVQARQWAAMNPQAKMYGRPITIEDHQASPYLVEPYRMLDMCLMTDGAIAFVLTTADRARSLKQPPVFVRGIGFGEHASDLWWRNQHLTSFAFKQARDTAFRMADVTLEDIQLAQLYDCFTAEVILQLEDYGWCGKGDGGPFVEEGNIGPGGRIPVNTYGGLLGAYHMSDSGGIAEAVVQLRGAGGPRQIDGASTCLVSALGGEIVEPICAIASSLVLGS